MNEKRRISLFLARPDETQRSWAAEARAAAEQHGAELTEYWADDATSQAHQIGECIWKDLTDALVILPASQSGPATLLIQALDRGKAVVLVNETRNDLSPDVAWSFPRLKQSHPSVLAARVAPDETEIGRVQGRQVRALLPRGGQVLYVQGATMSSGALARGGIRGRPGRVSVSSRRQDRRRMDRGAR